MSWASLLPIPLSMSHNHPNAENCVRLMQNAIRTNLAGLIFAYGVSVPSTIYRIRGIVLLNMVKRVRTGMRFVGTPRRSISDASASYASRRYRL